MPRTHRALVCCGCLLSILARTGAAHASEDAFAHCRQQLAEAPQSYESAYCFHAVAVEHRLWDAAAGIFEKLTREQPENFWLPLAYGHMYRDRDPDEAERLYRRAATGFQARGQVEGEILARSNLRNYLFPKGRKDAADAEMVRVAELGAQVTDPLLLARIWALQAAHLQDNGGDTGLAYRLLRQVEQAVFPDGPYRLKRTSLTSLGLVAFRMGRHDEALTVFRRLDALAAAEGDRQTRAVAQYNLLNTLSLRETLLPTPGARTRLLRLAEATLATGTAAPHAQVTLKTHRTIAALLANEPGGRGAALEHVDRCLELAVRLRQPGDEAVCAWLAARLLHDTDPGGARKAHLRALQATEHANSPVSSADSAGRHMQFSWRTKPRGEAIEDSLAMIEAIETLRTLQHDGDSSAAVFGNWTLDYYWLSGRLLQDGTDADLALAFEVTERLRARSLLDTLVRSRPPPDPAHPAVAARRILMSDIAAAQRTLMLPTLAPERRRDALARLEQLELRERELARQVALAFPREAASPSFATLDAVQSALGVNEALLSYQVGIWQTYEGEFGGGAWLTVITRDRRLLHRIPDRSHFAPIVPVFNGLLTREDGVDAVAAARLHRDVFGQALDALPPHVTRLIVVPDGPLQRLAFGALRATPDAPPLAARYELTFAPSATLWLHWRRNAQGGLVAPRALTLADPDPGFGAPSEATERQAVLSEGLRLGRLPHARAESRTLARFVTAADTLIGAAASESALKARDLTPYGLLHVAAHALSDEAHPERSAVLLAPGDPREDGLLQAREIQDLDLAGRIVVLSACQTASGAMLQGEGVLSLARAFFEAGARTVIGTRWAIRDADAAMLFDAFYRHLGDGASVSEALSRAKRHALAAGRPASVWAGVELLGDGSVRPFPARDASTSATTFRALRAAPALVGVAAFIVIPLLVVGGVWLVRRRAAGT